MRWATVLAVVAVAALGSAMPALAVPAPPTGVTALALPGSVELAWQPLGGSKGYTVYRGTSPSSITTALTSVGGVAGTSFVDKTAANGTTYYYAIRATVGANQTANSLPAQATPRAASCSTGNAIAVENCFPGTTAWKLVGRAQPPGGIEGFATVTSVNTGASVALKVNTAAGAPYRIEIYRTGYYGGTQARLISVQTGLTAVAQPSCQTDPTIGLVDCSNWATSTTISTTADWPSGVYLLRLVRTDNGNDNHILLVVRRDTSTSALTYQVPVATYQAYNNYGGKSLYNFNSSGSNTAAGTPRAVKVSYDRPYNESLDALRNWYTYSDIQNVSWLEQQGYDVSYVTSLDVQERGSQLKSHKAFVSPAHDEYWSAGMRSAVTAARDAGVSLVYLGSNADYWKIRFEASPFSAVTDRVQVCYKTTENGAVDPSGIPTGTWRDPAGANQPENALIGQMYVGDEDSVFFPLVVSAAQGQSRAWRYTTLATLAPGTTASIGQNLVGWEWDARVANGFEPAGVTTVASSPVVGELLQDAGSVYANGSTNATATVYRAGSGAWVFATGSQHWSRGLGYNMDGVGEPSTFVQQATVNVLADMGARPTTPSLGLTLDAGGAPAVTQTSPAGGAAAVDPSTTVTVTFDKPVDRSTVTTQSFTLAGGNATQVAATVSFDAGTNTATLTPAAPLRLGTTYTATVSTAVKTWAGTPLAAAVSFSFTTRPLTVSQTSPAAGATNLGSAVAVTATFAASLDPATVNSQNFTLADGNGAVAASLSYDDATRTATLTPSQPLSSNTTYTASLTTGIHGADGSALGAPVSWSFTTASCPCSLFSPVTSPSQTGLATQDGRPDPGPWSYELGVKIQVSSPVWLTAIRFYKDSLETGVHVANVWSAGGTLLASTTFTAETASGWQEQALTSALVLQPGRTYVISVGVNDDFVSTPFGLQTQITSGPLASVADGQNGVFGSAAGVFPAQSYQSTSYLVDAVVS